MYCYNKNYGFLFFYRTKSLNITNLKSRNMYSSITFLKTVYFNSNTVLSDLLNVSLILLFTKGYSKTKFNLEIDAIKFVNKLCA